MSIEISPIRRVFRYNGIALPDVPGLEPREVRDLYSAQYPELISADIEAGEVSDGLQEFSFRKAVGTKGGEGERLAVLRAAVVAELEGLKDSVGKLAQALLRGGTQERARAWGTFAQRSQRDEHDGRTARVLPASEMQAPLP